MIAVAVVLAAGFVAGMTYLTRDSGNRLDATDGTRGTAQGGGVHHAPHRSGEPAPRRKSSGAVMQSPPMANATIVTAETPRGGTATPPPCAGVADAGSSGTFAPGFTGMSGMELHNQADPNVWMVAHRGLPGTSRSGRADSGRGDVARLREHGRHVHGRRPAGCGNWRSVRSRPTRAHSLRCSPSRDAVVSVLTTKVDVVIDVLACSSGGGTQATDLAKQIADKVS